MTDDEAFIRAIVDAPGDDAPRLIYADWLDERGDPRGAYLRAEVECASSRLQELLRQKNSPLDAVWVARVSRPPLGVCCVATRFRDTNANVTQSDIHLFESRFDTRFPPDYRAFLLNYNGGSPHPRRMVYSGEILRFDVEWICPLLHDDRRTLETELIAQALEHFDRLRGRIEKRMRLITIGFLEDQFGHSSKVAVRLSTTGFGQVVLLMSSDSEGDLPTIANSFTQFVELIDY